MAMLAVAIQRILKPFRGDRRGNVGLLFGLLAVPMTIAVGVSIDYGMASSARTKLQSALDAAVLAGAAASSTQTQTAAIAVAKQVFAADTSDLNAGASASFSFDASGDLNGTARRPNISPTLPPRSPPRDRKNFTIDVNIVCPRIHR